MEDGIGRFIDGRPVGGGETTQKGVLIMSNRKFYEECLKRVKEIARELDELAAQSRDELEDNGEDLYSYFEDALDIEYRIGSDGEYRGVVVTLTTGGPHIEVNTIDRAVNLWWGGDKTQWSICGDTANAIDEIFKEYYYAIR